MNAEMTRYLRDLEIQAYLDKLKYRNRAKRWDMPPYNAHGEIKYTAYPGEVMAWAQD
jgi:hypothetical protein